MHLKYGVRTRTATQARSSLDLPLELVSGTTAERRPSVWTLRVRCWRVWLVRCSRDRASCLRDRSSIIWASCCFRACIVCLVMDKTVSEMFRFLLHLHYLYIVNERRNWTHWACASFCFSARMVASSCLASSTKPNCTCE